jgi:hypothetical protein
MKKLEFGFHSLLLFMTERLIVSEQHHYYNTGKIIFIIVRCTELNSNNYIHFYIRRLSLIFLAVGTERLKLVTVNSFYR